MSAARQHTRPPRWRTAVALVAMISLAMATFGASPAAADGKAWGGDVIVRAGHGWNGYSCHSSCDVNLGSYNYIRVRVDCNWPSSDYYSAWMTASQIEGGSWGKSCLWGVNKVQLQVSTRKGFCSFWHHNCDAFVQNYT